MRDFLEFLDIFQQLNETKAHFMGSIGESIVNDYAQQHLNDDYYILSDIVLKSNNGTTQIDQIIVSKFGLFVVEIKSHKGWIFGDANSAQWTQALTSGKYRFQNPLRQNYKHIKSLQSILGYPDNYFISLVAFSGQAEFKTQLPDNIVGDGDDYLRFIIKYQTVLFSDDEVAVIIKKILDNRLSHDEHQKYMQKIKQQYQNADEHHPPDCPRCASKMVLRKSKSPSNKGQTFWGCSRYPQCKAIVNIANPAQQIIAQSLALEKMLNLFF